jgi:phosphoribosylformylglycinamidine cyclo-ligase
VKSRKKISYAQSGVSIDANDVMVEKISTSLSGTFSPRCIELKNGFAGLFRMDSSRDFSKNYKKPVLVACTDGVGTKVLIAAKAKRYFSVGQDLVAMSVNDMLTLGAEPLFFLDYLGVHVLEPSDVARMVAGVAAGCKLADCALIGGETAEMPDIYRKGDFDMAGFAVGVVEKDRIIDGSGVTKGDVVLGLASSGIHSNGYSLVRHICFKQNKMKLTDTPKELGGATLADALLEPTRIYVRSVVKVLSQVKRGTVRAMAHITGGGLVGNVPRVIPKGCNVVLKKGSWPVPPVFKLLQKNGPVAPGEMLRVFNMGIGYVMVVDPKAAASVARKLEACGEKVYQIGLVTAGTRKVVLK